MMSTRTGVRALVMVTLCYGALEIVGLLLLLLLLWWEEFVEEVHFHLSSLADAMTTIMSHVWFQM